MFERNIYDSYRLYSEKRFKIDGYECFEAGGIAYILFPKDESASDETDMLTFVSFLRSAGDTSVPELIQTAQGANFSLVEGVEMYLCQLPQPNQLRMQPLPTDGRGIGEHLASWHQFGRQVQSRVGQQELFGQWGTIWTTRLEQLENWYEELYMQGPRNVVDETFLTTYPYFMGLSENAIQYVVDTDLDGTGNEYLAGTLCHRRFSDKAWISLSSNGAMIKPPTAFVYDHPARDLAEWLRNRRYQLSSQRNWKDAQDFFEGYQRHQSITPASWRLMFSRLLYPVHYFETIEDYYRCQIPIDQQKLGQSFLDLIAQEKVNETFLHRFAEERYLPNTPTGFPKVDWL
ncbi:spore coat putative kinase YutH [Alkalicoccobacillus plakortidis]|uniref:Spore coat protein YutH n=1 Tax=Alkalicoccobacillus plakortidis TaxID=444060 RepID=A0ABT0XHT4_9BACI|nr:spore coat protein YutH [Alkalicoccobacillus plakortidis]MCM2675468.1 spore coat protein YutH [Alkalicoccobacillus plakortidis]